MTFRLSLVAACCAAGLLRGPFAIAQTKATDRVPPFTLSYFLGRWEFDWAVPETPLGPGGDLVGDETYGLVGASEVLAGATPAEQALFAIVPQPLRAIEVVRGDRRASGPEGEAAVRFVMTYDPRTAQAIRVDADAHQVIATRKGKITGDLGGIYTFTWEAAPVQRGGHSLVLKGRTVAYSPKNYREFIQLSTDGEAFVTYGQPWYRKSE